MNAIELDGFSIINKFISEPQVNEILSALERRNVLDFDDENASGFNLLRTIPAVRTTCKFSEVVIYCPRRARRFDVSN